MDLISFAGMGPLTIFALVIVVALLFFYAASRYRVANANEALIVAGSKGAMIRDEQGKLVAATADKGLKVVVGGGTFVLPLVHKIGKLDLRVKQVPIGLKDAVTLQGIRVAVQGVATFKIGRDVESLRSAAERFLGNEDELPKIVQNVLEGSLRAIIGTLSVEQLISDRQTLLQRVQEAATGDLSGSGIVIDNLTIQSMNDESGYVELIGMRQIAVAEKEARVAKAAAGQEATVKEAEAKKLEIAATLSVSLAEAEAKMTSAAAQARADQAGPQAQAQAEQEVVTMLTELAQRKSELRERELIAEIVKPAEANRKAIEQNAEADKRKKVLAAEAEAESVTLQGAAQASATLAIGTAEAQALEKKAEAYSKFNDAAIIQTVLTAMPAIVEAAAKPMEKIGSMTVISNDGATEVMRNGTRAVAEAAGLFKGFTGIDVADRVRKALGTGPSDASGDKGSDGGSGDDGSGGSSGSGGGSPRPSAPPSTHTSRTQAPAPSAAAEALSAVGDEAARVRDSAAALAQSAPASAPRRSRKVLKTVTDDPLGGYTRVIALQTLAKQLIRIPGIERWNDSTIETLEPMVPEQLRPYLPQLSDQDRQLSVREVLTYAGN